MNDIVGKKLEKMRIDKVLPYISGKLLDIGCGNNELKEIYGNGLGVDVYDWGNVDIIVEDTSKIPLEKNSIDTITIIAALNHIPNRDEVLIECERLLSDDGKLIITMIPPIISRVWHFIRKPWDVDQSERGMKEGEVYGLTPSQVVALAKKSGFKLKENTSFMFTINKLYVFEKIKSLNNKANKLFISKYMLISIIGYGFIFLALYIFIDVLNYSEKVSFIIVYAINYILIYLVQLKFLFKTKHDTSKLIRFLIYLATFYLAANLLFNLGVNLGFHYFISTILTIILLFPIRLIVLKKLVYKD